MEIKTTNAANANDMSATLARGVDQVTIGAHDTINSVSAAARPAVDRMTSGAHDVVDRVAGVATQAAQTLSVTGKKLKGAEQKVAAGARGYLREHPVASLGVALAAGVVLSRLFSTRSGGGSD